MQDVKTRDPNIDRLLRGLVANDLNRSSTINELTLMVGPLSVEEDRGDPASRLPDIELLEQVLHVLLGRETPRHHVRLHLVLADEVASVNPRCLREVELETALVRRDPEHNVGEPEVAVELEVSFFRKSEV